jgi:hypothetical protein
MIQSRQTRVRFRWFYRIDQPIASQDASTSSITAPSDEDSEITGIWQGLMELSGDEHCRRSMRATLGRNGFTGMLGWL